MTTYEPADWRPGDLARITVQETTVVACLDTNRSWRRLGYETERWYESSVQRAVRVIPVDPASVVTLDPNNPDDQKRFRAAAVEAVRRDGSSDAALRSLLPTPPLPEPNGLGAVVRGQTPGGKAATWVRAIRHGDFLAAWALSMPDTAGDDRWWRWERMSVAEVESHGVGCSCGGPGCPGGSDV